MSTVTDLQSKFRNSRLKLKPGDYERIAAAYGRPRVVPKEKTIGARLARSHRGVNGYKVPASETRAFGEAPDGFGTIVTWRAEDRAIALVIYLNAADPMGVAINGVRATDTITFLHSAGHASFSETTENEGAASLIGIAAAGATLGATAFGLPEAAPVINAAAGYAKEQFKEQQVKSRVRDPFGVDPSSREKARQEGGVLVCLPTAQSVFSSGDEEKYWIKRPGNRIDANRPDHIKDGGFFLRRGMGPYRSLEAGLLTLVAWDHNFADNAGYYRLHVIMKRGNGKLPKPVPVT